MKIIFFVVTKKSKDSFEFFSKLDSYGLHCDINITQESITIHRVPIQLRGKVISDIMEVFNVESIQTRKDDPKIPDNASNNTPMVKVNETNSKIPHNTADSIVEEKIKRGILKLLN